MYVFGSKDGEEMEEKSCVFVFSLQGEKRDFT